MMIEHAVRPRGVRVGEGLGGRYMVKNDTGVRAGRPQTGPETAVGARAAGDAMIAHRNWCSPHAPGSIVYMMRYISFRFRRFVGRYIG